MKKYFLLILISISLIISPEISAVSNEVETIDEKQLREKAEHFKICWPDETYNFLGTVSFFSFLSIFLAQSYKYSAKPFVFLTFVTGLPWYINLISMNRPHWINRILKRHNIPDVQELPIDVVVLLLAAREGKHALVKKLTSQLQEFMQRKNAWNVLAAMDFNFDVDQQEVEIYKKYIEYSTKKYDGTIEYMEVKKNYFNIHARLANFRNKLPSLTPHDYYMYAKYSPNYCYTY